MLFSKLRPFSYATQSNPRAQRGFSLVELMVTVGIVVLVTGIALVRYGSFNNAVILRSQAFELALDIREAQLAGVSVRPQEGATNLSQFRDAYGIYFNISAATGNRNAYQLFLTPDEVYNAGENLGEPFLIDPRFQILRIETNSGCQASAASIVFRRPNFNALMRTSGCGNSPTSLRIVLAGTQDTTVTRSVVVYESGLITVE